MKIKYRIILGLLFISASVFSQKEQIKLAEKSLKSGNPAEAKATLLQVENMIVNSDNTQKAQYYFLMGTASFDLAKKNVETSKNLVDSSKYFAELLEIETNSGKEKYTTEAELSLKELKVQLFNSALADDREKKYKESALKLYQVYQIEKKDSIMLFYAAGSALNSQDYDLALTYFNKLKEINFSGKGTSYFAKSKINDKEDFFTNLNERDVAVKIGTHTNPRNEKITSKRGEISKFIAQIYIQKNDVPAAKKSIIEARKLNPDDISLLLSEADLYLKTDDFVMYKKLISEAVVKNPNDADLFYNLGVISSKSKDDLSKAEAEKYYIKAIEINPQYRNAYMNLAVLKLEGEKSLVEQMNKLGTTPADNKKYDVLKAKKTALYKSALPYLEKAEELFTGDADVKSTLMNVYNALDMTEKYKALKAKK